MSEFVVTRDENTDELMHYGVLGMKWGHRKAQARSYQKQLNSLDKESTHQIAKYMKADVKAKKYGKKDATLINKNDVSPRKSDTKKLAKITRKINKSVDKRNTAEKAYKNADSKAWKVMAEAAQNDYKITSKQVFRNGEIGRTYLQAALAGPLGSTVIDLARYNDYAGKYQTTVKRTGSVVDQTPWSVSGNKYKVRDNQ